VPYSYVMRAHEAHAHGVSLSKKARCFTVFSTSKDHNQGSAAICGCILVDFHRLEVRVTRERICNLFKFDPCLSLQRW